MKKIKSILLIDDNADDNFFHERVIRKNDIAEIVISKQSGDEALHFLSDDSHTSQRPELIFLDINMPGMNGWEFLQKFNAWQEHQDKKSVVVILTTSENPDDVKKAADLKADFKTKPLTKEMLVEIIGHYFK